MALNIPLTGSMAKGPLGLVHLPRMWQKALLKKTGVLPDDGPGRVVEPQDNLGTRLVLLSQAEVPAP